MSDRELAAELVLRFQNGDDDAASPLFQRYSERLARLVGRMLGERLRVREGTDDIVTSAFRTFFRRTREGKFQIDHSTALWKLLVRITRNKVLKKVSCHTAKQRDFRREAADPDQVHAINVLDHDPREVEASELLEELVMLTAAADPLTQAIIQRLLGGTGLDSSNRPALVQQLGREFRCSEFTIQRRLKHLEERLADRLKRLRDS